VARILFIVAGENIPDNPTNSIPLGVLYLASYLRKTGSHVLHVFDMNIESGGVSGALSFAMEFKPDIIGISARTNKSPIMHALATQLKNTLSEARIVVGGPHPSAYVEETLANKAIDVAVLGEGEATFSELVPLLEAGADFSGIRGIAFMRDGLVIKTEPRPFIEDLNTLPFPAWDLLKIDEYWKRNSYSRLGPRPYMPLFSSRACSYGCIFCHKLFGKKYRSRSPENVLEEIEILISRFGIKDFEFVDDCFNLDRRRVSRICDEIISRKLRLTLAFPNGLRGDLLDHALLKKMKEAGTREIGVAIETVTPRLQKMIAKNLNLEKVIRTIDDARRLGIPCDGYFMLGFPTETEEEMRNTIQFAVKSNLLYAHFMIVTPFLGTVLAERYKEKAAPFLQDLGRLHLYNVSQHQMSDVPTETVVKLQRDANRKFYVSVQRILRILWATPQKRKIPFLAFKFVRNKVIGS